MKILSFALLCLSLSAHAAKDSGGAARQSLSVSGGIAAAAPETAVFQNPGALSKISGSDFLLHAIFPDKQISRGGYGAGLSYGKREFGFSFGGRLSRFANQTRSSFSGYYGLGVRAVPLDATVGISGITPLSEGGGASHFNAGILFEPRVPFEIGFTAYDLAAGPGELGAGLVYTGFAGMDLVFDVAMDKDLSGVMLGPGLRVAAGEAALTFSYGVRGQGTFSSAQVLERVSLGAGFKPSRDFGVQVYYNQLAQYFVCLSAGM